MPFITIVDRLSVVLWSFFTIALICDYGNIRVQFPFLTHQNILIRLFGIALFGFLGLLLSVLIPEVFVFLIYG